MKITEKELKPFYCFIVERMYDLPCYDHCKSFYGKATVIEYKGGSKALKSYDTIVCKLLPDGTFIRTWSGESRTTMRHINSFLHFFNVPGGGIEWYRKQEVKTA